MTDREHSLADVRELVILLVAPSHDALTEYTSKLLEDFPPLGSPTILCKIKRPTSYDELLSLHSINPLTTDVALIFSGHGDDSSLQGPGEDGDALDYTMPRSHFFDQTDVLTGPKHLLAFCSKAALDLGATYERKTNGRTFIGFDEEIGLVIKDGVYADWWRRILHGLASAMLNASDTVTPEKLVQALYNEALSFFAPHKDHKYEWGLMMRAYLRQQLESINFIRT